MQILRELKSAFEYMSNAERKVAEVILKDPEGFIGVALGEFSAQAQVSQGSIVNFAKKYCGGGFTNLKQAVALALEGEKDVSIKGASLKNSADKACCP